MTKTKINSNPDNELHTKQLQISFQKEKKTSGKNARRKLYI